MKLVKKVENNGKIKILLTDQYSGINSKDFKQYINTKDIRLIFTAVDCAFSNGMNEKTNQILVNRIRCKIYKNKKRPWPIIAEECIEEYNNTVHSSTGFTPNYLLTGVDNSILQEKLEINNEKNLKENKRIAYENSKKIHEQNKSYYDKKVKNIEYKVGDLVYVQNGNELSRNKLDMIRTGSYRIKEKLSNVIYVIDSGFKKKESNLFHASKLVPYGSWGPGLLPKKGGM